jgi:hypothetical protein
MRGARESDEDLRAGREPERRVVDVCPQGDEA